MDNSNLSCGWAHTLIVWGAIGPLVGIFVGHVLIRSWQQKQWMLDRRKEEWRELLTTLTPPSSRSASSLGRCGFAMGTICGRSTKRRR
jgi:hypothetical protein